MSAIAATMRPIPFPSLTRLRGDAVTQAFTLLRIGFFVLPVLMGLDKFAEVLNDDWTAYLATEFNDILPGNAQDAMYTVGVVEIVAGFVVLVMPRFGGLLVAGWLAGIIVSLLLVGGYGDIVLRDVGLLLGALTLFRLAGTQSVRDARSWSQRADRSHLTGHRERGDGLGAFLNSRRQIGGCVRFSCRSGSGRRSGVRGTAMIDIETEIHIARPAGEVFAFVADQTNAPR